MAQVELCRTKEFPGIVQVDAVKNRIARRMDEEVARLEEIKQVSKDLKLIGQVELCKNKIMGVGPELRAESSLDPSHYYPPFSAKERAMFTSWLPDTRRVEQYGRYAHDRLIPEKVLLELAAIQGFGFFDLLEVMTHQDKDTFEVLLVGYRGEEAFRVARWGERLRPMKSISEFVWRAFLYEKMKAFAGSMFYCVSAVLSLGFGALLLVIASLSQFFSTTLSPTDIYINQLCFYYMSRVFGVGVVLFLFTTYFSRFEARRFFSPRR